MADPPTPGSPSSGRHKIFARRVLTTLIKAPCILPAVIRSNVKHLETPAENHQPTKTSGPPLNHGTLAPLSLDYPTLSQELQYELSAWFHELQWKHARLATMNTKRLGAWLIDSPELEFRLPNALDVRVTVESTSPFGRPDKILLYCLMKNLEPSRLSLQSVNYLACFSEIEENTAYFLKYEFYTPKQMDIVSETVTRLCAEVRGYVVSLIDAFRYSDHIINSPFGKYDGNVYSAYFNAVQAANPLPPVHPYFDQLIKPMLTQEPYVPEFPSILLLFTIRGTQTNQSTSACSLLRLEMGDASQIGINQEIEEIQQERLQGVNESNEGAIPLTESQRQETEGVAEWEKKHSLSKRAKKLFYHF
ncbi:hypothetical protein PSTG_10811 [Puccinia striiformis f. sp. tritici PST-78]|uniref:Acyl-CoA oxidase C-terminal domain-containing protein n=1 Tax=Puccinia striiformis f. sp. tritici PST-78 TaxID=1165861 RepID=A0A0L0VA86_9BASI|nr:hypothetical protein PSTG_10811 [Puccinia striiformis f. sp. tritici PST-78]